MQSLEDFIASQLLRVKAIKLQPANPFTWGTGWLSPIYCDNRKVLSYPKTRNVIKIELARLIAELYPEVEVIAGVATNAIAMGTLVANDLGLPLVYVHPTPKDHGFENMIEGDLRPRQNVVIVEDQISVGINSQKVADAIRRNGCKVLGIVTIFNYNMEETAKRFEANGVPIVSLTNFDAVIKKAVETRYINKSDVATLRAWQKNPEDWKK